MKLKIFLLKKYQNLIKYVKNLILEIKNILMIDFLVYFKIFFIITKTNL
jgi:hypothetical protein